MSSGELERRESEAGSTAGLLVSGSGLTGCGSLPPRRWKRVPVTVVLPDCSAYFMELREDCRGFDCLAKMCEVLGIVEVDYFGLKFSDTLAGCEAWVNTRLNLRRQLKRSCEPYRLAFRVKYFTDPHLLQQPSTKQAFFTDLRRVVQRGRVPIPPSLRPILGALTAQIEIGSYKETRPRSQALVYPPYFPDWSEGIAYQISREHKNLTGMSKQVAIEKYLDKMSEVECGINSYRGYFDDKHVTVEIGCRHIHIIDSASRATIHRIPYYSMSQVSFGSTFFGLQHHSRDESGESVERKLRIVVRNKYMARHMFREATEQQVFFHQATVMPEVRNHCDNHSRRFRRLCKRVLLLRETGEKLYYFDIVRTKHETYSHCWQLLHQVQQQQQGEREGVSGSRREGEQRDGERDTAHATVTIESDDSASQIDSVDGNKVYWGLSTSSYHLARDLLAEPHLHSCDSDTSLFPSSPQSPPHTFTNGTSKSLVVRNHSSPSQIRLNHTQSKKLHELLLNIQEERLCQVCMCSRISAVFCPCGHHVACYRCARRLVKCPICRQPIGYVQYVYTQ